MHGGISFLVLINPPIKFLLLNVLLLLLLLLLLLAKPLYEESLPSYHHPLSSLPIIITTSLLCHSSLRQVLGNMDEAKPLYEESLQLRTVVYGERSIKVAESKQNLATILDSQGRFLGGD